ncbi:hypothetical protein MMC21_007506 [Puttea exsequens]|nr:hypothetical protein [Puttea exsequens]
MAKKRTPSPSYLFPPPGRFSSTKPPLLSKIPHDSSPARVDGADGVLPDAAAAAGAQAAVDDEWWLGGGEGDWKGKREEERRREEEEEEVGEEELDITGQAKPCPEKDRRPDPRRAKPTSRSHAEIGADEPPPITHAHMLCNLHKTNTLPVQKQVLFLEQKRGGK